MLAWLSEWVCHIWPYMGMCILRVCFHGIVSHFTILLAIKGWGGGFRKHVKLFLTVFFPGLHFTQCKGKGILLLKSSVSERLDGISKTIRQITRRTSFLPDLSARKVQEAPCSNQTLAQSTNTASYVFMRWNRPPVFNNGNNCVLRLTRIESRKARRK